MARSGQDAGEPRQALVAAGGSTVPPPEVPGLDTKMAWGLVGLGLVGHMLRNPRFYETVAVAAIAAGSLRQLGQQNQASMTARLAAWNQREIRRLERKAQRQAAPSKAPRRWHGEAAPGAWRGRGPRP